MRSPKLALAALLPLAAWAADAPSPAAAEFHNRWTRTKKMTMAVAEAMPPAQYAFRPDPGSMSFAELLAHIAWGNRAFCAGLKDEPAPPAASPAQKDAVVKLLEDSIDYCSGVLAGLTGEQLEQPHNSPDGRMPGREILLAMYAHVSHHRGQAEIYLRIKGIQPPGYIF